MFEAKIADNIVLLSGRLDASQADKARAVLEQVTESCVVNFKDLEYISSVGLGILVATQKRLNESGHSLKLVKFTKHVADVFRYAGFHMIFEIEES